MAMVDAKMAQKQRKHRILTCLCLFIMTIISISLSIRFSGLDGILYGVIFAILLAGNVLHIMRASQLKIVPIVLDKRAATLWKFTFLLIVSPHKIIGSEKRKPESVTAFNQKKAHSYF